MGVHVGAVRRGVVAVIALVGLRPLAGVHMLTRESNPIGKISMA